MVEEYAYNFESPYTLAPYKASLDFHGYPDDYLQTYRDQVKAVTRDEAAGAARLFLPKRIGSWWSAAPPLWNRNCPLSAKS